MPSMQDVIMLRGDKARRLRAVTGDGRKGMAQLAGWSFLELSFQLHQIAETAARMTEFREYL
jgi:hypothetical protein